MSSLDPEIVHSSTIAEMEEMIARGRRHSSWIVEVRCAHDTDEKEPLSSLHLAYESRHWQRFRRLITALTPALDPCVSGSFSSPLTVTRVVLRSMLDDEQTKTHARALADLVGRATHVVGMLEQNDKLTFLRMRSKQREITVGVTVRCVIRVRVGSATLTLSFTSLSSIRPPRLCQIRCDRPRFLSTRNFVWLCSKTPIHRNKEYTTTQISKLLDTNEWSFPM